MTIGMWAKIQDKPFPRRDTIEYCVSQIIQDFQKIINDEGIELTAEPKIILKNGGLVVDPYSVYGDKKIQLYSTVGIKAEAKQKSCSISLEELRRDIEPYRIFQ